MTSLEDVRAALPVGLSGFGLFDLLIHGGEWVIAVFLAVVEVLLGSPELVVVMLSYLDRITARIPVVDPALVSDLLTIALVAMFALSAIRFASHVIEKT